jgi:hypothetical protein
LEYGTGYIRHACSVGIGGIRDGLMAIPAQAAVTVLPIYHVRPEMVDGDRDRATPSVARTTSARTPTDLSPTSSPSAPADVPAALGQPLVKSTTGRRRRVRSGVLLGAAALLVFLVVGQRSLIAASVGVLGHLKWTWLLAAVPLEWVSMTALARMQGRLLTAGHARVRPLPILATVYAGNAISATVPLAGPQMGVVFAFRRFKQLGVDGVVVAWTLVVAGLISSLAAALVLTVGAVLTGNDVVAVTGVVGGVVAVAIGGLAMVAVRCSAVRRAVEPPAAWILARARRRRGRPGDDPAAIVAGVASRLRAVRLPPAGWAMVTLAAVLNWLADAGVLAASLAAVGAPVPWRGLLLAYALGTAASSISVTPGGLAVAETALALSLMGVGVRHPLALAAALVYRFVSFWLVVSLGWLAYLLLRREPAGSGTIRQSHRSGQKNVYLPIPIADLQARQGRGDVSLSARRRTNGTKARVERDVCNHRRYC